MPLHAYISYTIIRIQNSLYNFLPYTQESYKQPEDDTPCRSIYTIHHDIIYDLFNGKMEYRTHLEIINYLMLVHEGLNSPQKSLRYIRTSLIPSEHPTPGKSRLGISARYKLRCQCQISLKSRPGTGYHIKCTTMKLTLKYISVDLVIVH